MRRLVDLWHKVPRPIRQAWGLVGWIEDHVSRAVLIVAVIVFVVTSGGVVTGFLSEAPPVALYLGGLAAFVLCIWAIAGLRLLLSPTAQLSRAAPSDDSAPSPAERPKETRIRVLPILKKNRMAGVDEARLRVENNGPEVYVGFMLERVSDFEHDAIPFRMKWVEPEKPSDDFFSRSLPKAPIRTQKYLPIGSLESAVAAYAFEDEAKLYIPMPDDLRLEVPRPPSGEIELTVATLTNPPLAKGIPARATYVIELSRRGRIKNFKVKKDEGEGKS